MLIFSCNSLIYMVFCTLWITSSVKLTYLKRQGFSTSSVKQQSVVSTSTVRFFYLIRQV
jgi:hypothetical protein